MEEGVAASVIAGSTLWPNGQPDQLRSLWQELKAALLAAGEDWHVWTTWYDDRLEGRVRQEERELAYVRIDDDLWNQGPAIVNAEIKRRIEELTPAPPPIETIPEQEPVATRFRVNSQGLIDVVPDPPTLDPPTDALQRELYNEVREKAQSLVELSPNLLGDLIGPATRFRESLPERIEDASISRSWSRGNTLRSQLKAHDLSGSRAEPDAARLPSLVAETLRDLVSTWNVFIIGDPKGRELDERRLGPQEVDAARQVIATAALLVQAVQSSENIATPRAIEAVIEQADAATHTPTGIDGDQAIYLSQKTSGNFVVQILRSAYEPVRRQLASAWKESRAGFYHAAGASMFVAATCAIAHYSPAIISFVAKNADALKAFAEAAWHNPLSAKLSTS